MRTKSIIAVAIATCVMALCTGVAGAQSLSANEGRFRIVWNELAIFAAGAEIRCPVTIEGSLHASTMRKIPTLLIGFVSRASVRGHLGSFGCTAGTMTIAQEWLPWHIMYESFTGALPRPSGFLIGLYNVRFRIDPLSVFLPACNMTTSLTNPLRARIDIEANGLVTGATADPTTSIPLEEGICPFGGEGVVSGTGRFTRLASTSNVRVTLI